MDYKDEEENPTTFNSSSQHRDYNLITLKQYLSIAHSAFIRCLQLQITKVET